MATYLRALTQRRTSRGAPSWAIFRGGAAVTAGIPSVFFAVFLLWPVVALIHRAIRESGDASIGTLLARTNAFSLVGYTVWQAAASTVAAFIVAAPMVWLVATAPRRIAALVVIATTVPFVMPTVVVGIAFRALLNQQGPLSFLHIDGTTWAIVAAHVFLNVAVITRIVGGAWRAIDPRMVASARSLGAHGVGLLFTVIVPRLVGPMLAAATLVFLFCASSFGVVIILGNGALQTLETAIYTQAISYFDVPAAVVLSIAQLVLVIIVVAVTRLVPTPRGAAVTGYVGQQSDRRRGRFMRGIALAWIVMVVGGPLAVVAMRSFRPTSGGAWTLVGYRSLTRSVDGQVPLYALGYGVLSAAIAAAIAMAIGLATALAIGRSRGWVSTLGNVVVLLPLGISAVTVGFGYLIVLAALPRAVGSSSLIIPAVQALVAAPIVIRIVMPALAAVPPPMRSAAAAAGAGPLRVFISVDLPLIWRAVSASGAFAFITALGEFGATSFLARPGTTTLPVLIGSSLNRPGAQSLATAMAASVLLIVATAAAVMVMEFLRTSHSGDF